MTLKRISLPHVKSFYGTINIPEDFLKLAVETIYENKDKFDDYTRDGQKLLAVKTLKELTGGGLRESKEVLDLIWDGQLVINSKKEDRKEKLEKLAKLPLINEIISKIMKLTAEDLRFLLTDLEVDDLLTIDEYLSDNESKDEN